MYLSLFGTTFDRDGEDGPDQNWWWWSHTNAQPGTADANDQLLGLDDQEENQAAEQKPRPNPGRDRLGLEQVLERSGISEQKLQDHHRAYAQGQVRVAKMRLERQG